MGISSRVLALGFLVVFVMNALPPAQPAGGNFFLRSFSPSKDSTRPAHQHPPLGEILPFVKTGFRLPPGNGAEPGLRVENSRPRAGEGPVPVIQVPGDGSSGFESAGHGEAHPGDWLAGSLLFEETIPQPLREAVWGRETAGGF